jgi:nucleoside-diphosphate-sugar epimerase
MQPLRRPQEHVAAYTRHGASMTTLIVGCGYLGRRIGAQLVARGDRVFGAVRSEQSASRIQTWGIDAIRAEVLDPSSLARLPRADHVVYCVGYDRSSGVSQRAVYVEGLRGVISALPETPKRMVYASSTGVYGQEHGEWVDEASSTEPRNESGRVCLEAENWLREFSRRSGLSSVVLRYAGLYGPGRIVRRDAVARGEPIVGDPERYLNLIHIDDAASAAVAALEAERPASLYIAADDRPVRRREYYELVAKCLNAPAPRFTSPRPGSAAAAREDSNKRASNQRLKADIGWRPRLADIAVGVPDALARSDEPR